MTGRSKINLLCRRGFTLIELAIVLLIVGILMGVGSGMVGMLYSSIRLHQTRDSMDDNTQAIAGWASANNKLPQLSGFTATVAKTQMDASTRPLVYLYYSSLAPATATKDTICGRRSTSLTVQNSSPTTTTISNVAYVLLSGGESSAATLLSTLTGTFKGVTYSNTPIPRPASSGTAVGGYASGTINVDPTSTDIIRWVTLDELRSKAGCQGAPLKIVNNELPFIPQSTAAGTTIFTISADGGVPITSGSGNYVWCVEIGARSGISLFDTVPTGGIKSSGTCWGLAETNFVQSTQLTLQKKATFGNFSTGSYQVTIFVRDGAAIAPTTASCSSAPGDNCVQKPFALTINPN